MRVLIKRLRAIIISAQLPYYLWYYILPTVLKLINNTAITNKSITSYQTLINNLNPGQNNVPNLGRYRIIGAPYEVLIPFKKKAKSPQIGPKNGAWVIFSCTKFKNLLNMGTS